MPLRDELNSAIDILSCLSPLLAAAYSTPLLPNTLLTPGHKYKGMESPLFSFLSLPEVLERTNSAPPKLDSKLLFAYPVSPT
jgi:hypothetical protein